MIPPKNRSRNENGIESIGRGHTGIGNGVKLFAGCEGREVRRAELWHGEHPDAIVVHDEGDHDRGSVFRGCHRTGCYVSKTLRYRERIGCKRELPY